MTLEEINEFFRIALRHGCAIGEDEVGHPAIHFGRPRGVETQRLLICKPGYAPRLAYSHHVGYRYMPATAEFLLRGPSFPMLEDWTRETCQMVVDQLTNLDQEQRVLDEVSVSWMDAFKFYPNDVKSVLKLAALAQSELAGWWVVRLDSEFASPKNHNTFLDAFVSYSEVYDYQRTNNLAYNSLFYFNTSTHEFTPYPWPRS